MTAHNGVIVEGVDRYHGVASTDNSPRLRAWIKERTDAGGRAVYDFAFTNAESSIEDQEQVVKDNYGAGYKLTPNTYYKINDEKAWRPYTFAERKKIDKDASFIRSIASTMQVIEHKLAGVKFNDEMIAEQAGLDWVDVLLFSVYASVASAQPTAESAAIPGQVPTMQDR